MVKYRTLGQPSSHVKRFTIPPTARFLVESPPKIDAQQNCFGYASHALAGRPLLSVCAGCIALLTVALHHWILTRMDDLHATMLDGDINEPHRFRELQVVVDDNYVGR